MRGGESAGRPTPRGVYPGFAKRRQCGDQSLSTLESVQVPSIRPVTLWLVLAPTLLFACDSDDASDQPRGSEQDSTKGHPHGSPVDKLCAAVDCSDPQRKTLTSLLTRKPAAPPTEETLEAANSALADAWRAADFDTDDLADWREQVHGDAAGSRMSAANIVAVHDVLEASQRAVLADLLETRGPGVFFGPRGHGKGGKAKGHERGKGHGRGDKADRGAPDPEAFAAHATDRLCERVSCSEDQRSAIVAAIVAAAPRREQRDDDRSFAAAFRGETLTQNQSQTYLDSLEARHEAERSARDGTFVAVHHVLTAEQRATLAADLAEHGPKGLMPPGGHDRHHKAQ